MLLVLYTSGKYTVYSSSVCLIRLGEVWCEGVANNKVDPRLVTRHSLQWSAVCEGPTSHLPGYINIIAEIQENLTLSADR